MVWWRNAGIAFDRDVDLLIIRTAKVTFFEGLASPALIATWSFAGSASHCIHLHRWFLGFVPLPRLYWPVMLAIIGDAVLTHVMKVWFVRRLGNVDAMTAWGCSDRSSDVTAAAHRFPAQVRARPRLSPER